MDYKKRAGTSGIGGQFFETKLLALILLRVTRDPRLGAFRLAANMDGVGLLDDVCLELSVRGRERPLALFMQLKHKDSDEAYITFDNKTKTKCIDSFLKIKDKISSGMGSSDVFYGNTSCDCVFILYTNGEVRSASAVSEVAHGDAALLQDLLATSNQPPYQLRHSHEDFGENILMLLARRFVKFLSKKDNGSMMNDEYIQQYHVILQQTVVNVGDIQTDEHKPDSKWRTLTFRDKFFDTTDKDIVLFRNYLCEEILKEYPDIRNDNKIDNLISSFLSEQSATTLACLIWTHISCNENGELKFRIKRSSKETQLLEQINLSPKIINEAMLVARATAANYLRSLTLRVPVTFGNLDVALRTNRLEHLVTGVITLCEQYRQVGSYKIVTIDDTVDAGLLKHNGGLASGVGTVLTHDEETSMLKFSNDSATLPKNAKALHQELTKKIKIMNGIDNFHEYRFDVQCKKFPKLHLDCANTAREFLDNFVIYAKQSNHSKIQDILKDEIQKKLNGDSRHLSLNSHSVFLHYHEEILQWWMTPHTDTYLTRTNNLYERAIINIKAEPLLSDLHTTFYMNNLRYFELSYSEEAIEETKLPENLSKIFIVTKTVTLTIIKVIQCLQKYYSNSKYVVLYIEGILNLPNVDFSSMIAELKKTERVVIVVWHDTETNSEQNIRLRRLTQATTKKRLFVITTKKFTETEEEYFSCSDDITKDHIESLTSMARDSQEKILRDSKVIFQGREMSLDLIIDEKSVTFIKGAVLEKMIRNETIHIGSSLNNSRYKEIKYYIERRIIRINKTSNDTHNARYFIKSFLDICDGAVLLTAPPGMGKSTLLTHLSLNTTRRDRKLWILRINFIDHSKQFYKWHRDNTNIDMLASLVFLCQVVLSNDCSSFNIVVENGLAHLENCKGDGLNDFELNMFLHFYNQRSLILVFDGFDEICPDYKNTVINFLTTVKTCLRKKKMWVTSRPYSDILPDLQRLLRKGFKMEHLSYKEQESYLKCNWLEKALTEKFRKHVEHLNVFIKNTRQSIFEEQAWIQFIYCVFVDTVRTFLRYSQIDRDVDSLLKRFRRRPVEDTLSGIPLILYFVSDYFANIIDPDSSRNNSSLRISLHDIYAMFVENKIKKILFQEKNHMDLTNAFTRTLCDRELDDCVSTHKKLAAHALLQEPIFKVLDYEEFKYMKLLDGGELNIELDKIKAGANKTGLISYVTDDNVPVFIHRSFTEYFAAEYACDILKSSVFDVAQKTVWYCAITEHCNEGVREWLYAKKKWDQTLENVFKDIDNPSPMYYVSDCRKYYFKSEHMSRSQFIRILASSVNDYETECFKEFSKKFNTVWDNIDSIVKEQLIGHLTSYFVSQMKPHLKQYFRGPTIFSLWNNQLVRDFNLATNVETLRQINVSKLKLTVTTSGQGVPYYMQLEHIHNNEAIETLHYTTGIKCIHISFNSNSGNILQNNGKKCPNDFDITDFICLLYNSKKSICSLNTILFSRFSHVGALDSLLAATGAAGRRLHYTEQHVEQFANILYKKDIFLLAQEFLSFFYQSASRKCCLRNFDCIQKCRYHDVLEKRVVDINSNVKGGIWRFCDNFLDGNDRYTTLFRNYVLKEILNKSPKTSFQGLPPDQLILSFLKKPSVTKLTFLIGTYMICYKDNELKFLVERPSQETSQLRHLNIPQRTVNEARADVDTAAIQYLRSLQLQVANDSHDVDVATEDVSMTLKMEQDRLIRTVVELCTYYVQTDSYRVVTIDDSVYAMLLKPHRGLAAIVGSILTYDEETKMLKFWSYLTWTRRSLRLLFHKLSEQIDELRAYRFNVRSLNFHRLYIQYSRVALEFLSNLVIYSEQEIHYEVEGICLEEKQKISNEPCYIFINSQLAFLHYHSEVLRWWMADDTGNPRRGTSSLYERASSNISAEPLISSSHTKFYFNNLNHFGDSISRKDSEWLELPKVPSKTFIVTDTVISTTVEAMHCFRKYDPLCQYTVLDLEELGNISTEDLDLLWTELRNTNKVVIIVWHNTRRDKHTNSRLRELLRATTEKRLLFIKKIVFASKIYDTCMRETEDLSDTDLQNEIIKDTNVIFQGRKIRLKLILDEESLTFVSKGVLEKILLNQTINIGTALDIPRADSENVCVYRRVSGVYRDIHSADSALETCLDVGADHVLLAARAGSSALLTRLAHCTGTRDHRLWIVRINFTDYSKQFEKWHNNKTIVDPVVSLTFLCQTALRNANVLFNLDVTDDARARLVGYSGDELAVFELQLFLYFYNQNKLILIFDGLDRICPYYKNKVVDFLVVVRTYLRKRKMWISSSPHCALLRELLDVLGTFSVIEQHSTTFTEHNL